MAIAHAPGLHEANEKPTGTPRHYEYMCVCVRALFLFRFSPLNYCCAMASRTQRRTHFNSLVRKRVIFSSFYICLMRTCDFVGTRCRMTLTLCIHTVSTHHMQHAHLPMPIHLLSAFAVHCLQPGQWCGRCTVTTQSADCAAESDALLLFCFFFRYHSYCS